jgi:hypothetical protein
MLLNEKVALVGRCDFVFQIKPDSTVSANILATTAVDAPVKVAADDAISRRNINDSNAPCRANISATTTASAFVRINNHPPTKTRLGWARLKGVSEGYSPCPQCQQQLFDL